MTQTKTFQTLSTLTETRDSMLAILAPAVGYYAELPKPGSILTGGSYAGSLKILNRIHDLFLPKGIQGRVVCGENNDHFFPVQYRQELFRLETGPGLLETVPDSRSASGHPNRQLENGEEGFLVKAFTTGIFYTKPSPDAPPFVEVGQVIEKGKAMGLIEVMKTFNHIIFQGTDTSDKGKVKKILVNDSQEVKQGQPLFLMD